MNTYRAKLSWALGVTEIAVKAPTLNDAVHDLRTAAHAFTGHTYGTWRVIETEQTTQKFIKTWTPIKGCRTNGKPWAWSGPHKGA